LLASDTRLASGQVVVNEPGGVLTLKGYLRALPGTQVIADQVVNRATIAGKPEVFDLFANSFDAGKGVTIDGAGPIPVGLPLFTFPTVPAVTYGTDSCPTPGRIPGDCRVRQRDGAVTIQPGSYRDIKVRANGTLYFAGGTYNVRSIRGALR